MKSENRRKNQLFMYVKSIKNEFVIFHDCQEVFFNLKGNLDKFNHNCAIESIIRVKRGYFD